MQGGVLTHPATNYIVVQIWKYVQTLVDLPHLAIGQVEPIQGNTCHNDLDRDRAFE